MRRIYFILILLLILCTGLKAYKGQTGYNFLKIDTGNRAIAMGGAYAGVSQDINSVFYNPAGVHALSGKQVSFMYRSWLLQTDFGSLSYAQDFPGIATFSASLIYYQLPETERVDSLGFSTGEMLSGNNYAFILTGARPLYFDITGGINFKYINEQIFTTENKSIVVDVGLQRKMYATPSDSIVIGLVLQNWNFQTGHDPADPVPVNIKTGMEYMAYKNFKLNLDINKQIDQAFRYNIGAEYRFFNMIFIRGGYKTGYDLESFAIGFGINSSQLYQKVIFNFDYSLTSLGLLARSQNFSLNIHF